MKLDNTRNSLENPDIKKLVVSETSSVITNTATRVRNILETNNMKPIIKTYSSYFEILNDLEKIIVSPGDYVKIIQEILEQNTFGVNKEIQEYLFSYLDTVLDSLKESSDNEKERIRKLFIDTISGVKTSDYVGIGEYLYQRKMKDLWVENLQNYESIIDAELFNCLENIQNNLRQLNFKGDFHEYLNQLKQKNKIRSYSELEEYFHHLSNDLVPFLKESDVFPGIDKIEYRIQETPLELKEYIPFAEYRYWPLYNNKENLWYITFNEGDEENYKQSFLDTFVHEFIPGHAYYYENVGNQQQHNNLLLEWWAIYSENLVNELGYYDQEMQVPLATYNLLRILRMKIDLELQTNRITFEEAVSLLTQKLGYSYDLAKSEVLWYSQEATTPSAYYLWYLKIKSWREAYLAKGFTIKEFHHIFLNLASKTQKVDDFEEFFT